MDHQLQDGADPLLSPGVTKLRTSCDACTESKLKCSKTKPACARCQTLRIPCIYSVSQRVKRVRSSGQRQRLGSRTKSTPQLSPNYQLPSNSSQWAPQYPERFTMPEIASTVYAAHDDTLPSLADDPWQQFGTDLNVFAATQEPLTTPLTPQTEPDCNSMDRGCPSASSSTNCRCSESIAERLSRTKSLTRASAAAAFDVLLAETKESIHVCNRVLGCKQLQKDTSDMLLVGSLLAALIGSFGAMLPQPWSQGSHEGADSANEDPTTATPLVIGAYEVDTEDLEQLKIGIATIEVCKLRALLERFEGLVGGSQGWGETPGSSRAVLGSMRQALSDQLNSTFSGVVNKIS